MKFLTHNQKHTHIYVNQSFPFSLFLLLSPSQKQTCNIFIYKPVKASKNRKWLLTGRPFCLRRSSRSAEIPALITRRVVLRDFGKSMHACSNADNLVNHKNWPFTRSTHKSIHKSVHMFIHMSTPTCLYQHAYTNMSMHVSITTMQQYIHKSTHMSIRAPVRVCMSRVLCTSVDMSSHICPHISLHTCVHTHFYTHVSAHTFVHMPFTRIQKSIAGRKRGFLMSLHFGIFCDFKNKELRLQRTSLPETPRGFVRGRVFYTFWCSFYFLYPPPRI